MWILWKIIFRHNEKKSPWSKWRLFKNARIYVVWKFLLIQTQNYKFSLTFYVKVGCFQVVFEEMHAKIKTLNEAKYLTVLSINKGW